MKFHMPAQATGLAAIAAAALVCAAPAAAQLRIATYNTLDKPSSSDGTAQGLFLQIMQSMGTDFSPNGITKRVDILALQEQTIGTTSEIKDVMNLLYGTSSYEVDVLGGGNDKVSVVYDSSTVDFLGSLAFATGGPRPTHRAHFRPVGYTSADAEFYVYSTHLKAGSDLDEQAIRGTEATAIRANADALGSDKHIVYAGDYNLYLNIEAGYVNMVAPGDAQALDPVDVNVSWHVNSSVAEYHTQSTRTTSQGDGGSTGGMDDRFDWQFITDALTDGEGLSYLGPTSAGLGALDHSYWAYGNDGVSYNQAITFNNSPNPRTLSATVINALQDFSDHLPVMADYQVPAIMDVNTSIVPPTVNLGSLSEVMVTVENIAAVVAAVGADELDYTITTSGDISGSAGGVDPALGGGNAHDLLLDTATPGLKSGSITVTSTSEAVENPSFVIPVNFEVLSGLLLGDANNDGVVSADDLVAVQQFFATAEPGVPPNAPSGLHMGDANDDGVVTADDLIIVQQLFGNALHSAGGAVPEPATACLLIGGLWMIARRRKV